MVERAQKDAAKLALTNVHVVFGNANHDLARLFDERTLARIYVHFPDPWFKKRHHKRRVVTPGFLEDAASRLEDGGELHFTSIPEVGTSFLVELPVWVEREAPSAGAVPRS